MSTEARPTIAVDVNPATREIATGTEVYTREVSARLSRIAPELNWVFYAARARAGLGVDALVLPFPRLWSQARLPIALARSRPDVLFVPAHAIPFAWNGKVLTVVHDLAFDRCPDAYSMAGRTYLRLSTRWAVSRCPLLIAVSEATKRDLVELYGAHPDRVRVVLNGGGEPPALAPSPSSRLKALGVNGSYVLQVGRVEPRKNQSAALAAVERLKDLTLVVAGPERDSQIAAALKASPSCRVLGAVSGADLELLYAHAEAVLVPSLYEGFGLPVLEAMSRGRVVVASATPSLREVGGEGALYVDDTGDAAQFAAVIERAVTDSALRKSLTRKSRARARTYTWDRCAEGVVTVVRELLR
jgi:glycosyltransferase involved in cell wall biosynthesis